MSKKVEKMLDKMMPVVEKIASQRHLCAIRDGFIALMPLIIAASFFVLINSVVLNSTNGIFSSFVDLGKYTAIGGQISNATLGILAILFAFTLSYNLAKSYDEDGLSAGVMGVSIFVVMLPAVSNIVPNGATEAVQISGVLTQTNTSSTGLFLAIIAGLLGTELFIKLAKNKKLKISLPETVPYGVAKSFNVMIPSIITLTIFAVLVFIINTVSSVSIPDLVTKIIQTPLQNVVQGAGGLLLITFFQNLLWAFGLHGSSILGPIMSPTLLTAIQENMTAYQAGLEVPHIVTDPFINSFSIMGGGGCTIGLIIAIFLVSKRAEYKKIAKLSSLPGVFNINEPIMFGLPVVLNPILAIPVVLVPAINLLIAYYATSFGLISKTVVIVPWTTPPVISAFLATGGDYRAALLAAGLLVLGIFIYIPFVMLTNNERLRDI